MFEEHSIYIRDGVLPDKGKILWHCRRGMKELEVLLLPYVEHFYDAQTLESQQRFLRLLGFDDASLFAWFMGYESPEDSEILSSIQEVQRAVASLQSS